MNATRLLVTSARIATAFGLLLVPSVSATNEGNNDPGENNTNLPGDQPKE